jgi:endo-1,4-beta-xylanase
MMNPVDRVSRCVRTVARVTVFMAALTLLGSTLPAQPLAEGHGKFLGSCTGSTIPDDFDFYWNQVTPENAGKWGSVETGRDVYQWDNLDGIYNYAKDRGIPFRLHVLVWGKQQPGWITGIDSTEQAEEVEEWIRLAGERYPDADYVEVVNEAIEWSPYDYYPSYRDALGGAGETGWDWVIWAFEKARLHFPNSKLLINEYQIFGGNKSIGTYLKIIDLLKERNLIDGLCEQGHFLESTGVRTIQSRLDQLAATGLPIQISEYDVKFADDAKQLAKFREQFPVLWEHPAVEGITFWGYKEGQLWRTDAHLVRSDGSERPALEWLRQYLSSTGVHETAGSLPADGILLPNYPNPFNPRTTIAYRLARPCLVKLTIVNSLGETVRTLAGVRKGAGTHFLSWDATDEAGRSVPSGVYYFRLETEGSDHYRKMLLLR